MPRKVAAVFPDRNAAEQALADLRSRLDVGDARLYATRKPPLTTGSPVKRTSKSILGAVVGSLIVGTIGSIVGWIAAVLAAGTVTSVTFAVVVASCVGGMMGWLIGGLAYPGTPVEEGEYYQEWVEQGRCVLAVETYGQDQEVQRVLAAHNAQTIQAAPERRGWFMRRGQLLGVDRSRQPSRTATS